MLLIKLFLTEKVCDVLNKRVFQRKGKNGVDRVGVLSIEGRGGGSKLWVFLNQLLKFPTIQSKIS